MDLFFLLLLIFGAALLVPILFPSFGNRVGWLLSLAPFFVFGNFLYLLPEVSKQGAIQYALDWVPSLGVSIDLRLDGLSLLMGALITGIGGFILLYASSYLKGHHHLGRFFSYMLMFMGAMLGLVLANNLILLFVFWELTSISSYLLIGFNHEDQKSRKNALQALLVTGLGGVAMLAGFIMLGQSAGTYLISELEQMAEHHLYLPILTLVLLGCFTKSAQFPFHFWLPNAMAAPTPVSAYLHSATMVKAGVYLMARIYPSLGGTDYWTYTLLIAGAITMLLGAWKGLFQTDLKKILAYTTLSVLGILTMLLGVSTELAVQAAIIFLLGHALYKAALFMVVGAIDHECKTRDVTLLGGLYKIMPFTAMAAMLAALSKAGFPPFFGFLGKEYVYKTGLSGSAFDVLSLVILSVAFVTNVILLALALKVGMHPFLNSKTTLVKGDIKEAPILMWIGPLVLALIGLSLGLGPKYLEKPLVEPAVSAILNQEVDLKMALWHGFNMALVLSLFTIASGILLYRFRYKLWNYSKKASASSNFDAEKIYYVIFDKMTELASWQTKKLQNGLLRNYFMVVIAATGIFVLIKLLYLGGVPSALNWGKVHFFEWGLFAVMAFATVMAVTTQSRLVSLLSLGIIGFGIALIFMFYGAPDLAATQLIVETLTVVLFLLVVYRLPKFNHYSSKKQRIVDAIFSISFGGLITALVLKAQNLELATSISNQFVEWSYTIAKGKNVVNVILVDFRALDTLGEITVLAIAALGVIALLKKKQPQQKGGK